MIVLSFSSVAATTTATITAASTARTSTATASATRASTAGSTGSATRSTVATVRTRCTTFAVEVRLATFGGSIELGSAFNGHASIATLFDGEFGALFAQDRLAAQLDAVAFERKDFHEDLVTFIEFVFHTLHAVFG